MELSMERLSQLVQIAADTGAKAALAVLDGNSEAIQKLCSSITQIVVAAALQGVEEIEREKEAVRTKEQTKLHDRRLRNMRLLLKHYRELKLHFENAIYEFDASRFSSEYAEGAIWEIMNERVAKEEVYVESIRASATRTMLIIQHIDNAMLIYDILSERSKMESMRRQYRILNARYIADEPAPISQIAEWEHINKRTAEKDLNEAIAQLAALIFGVDAIIKQ